MKIAIFSLLLLLAPCVALLDLDACGPFFPEAMFVYTMHPDFPLDDFAAGKLGILQATYARSYLYVAYRYMIGTGFNPEEQTALGQIWYERMNIMEMDASADVKVWLDARSKVPGLSESPAIDSYKLVDYQSFPNCTRDAFAAAAATLEDRVKKFGADNPAVRDWIQAQDLVFANCAGEPASIPQPAPATVPAVFRTDRQYQIAAAYFYSGDYASAQKRFQEIAADPNSSWKSIAPYLAVRALVRQGTLGAGIDQPSNPEILKQAERQLHQMPADPAVDRLLAYLKVRLDPQARAHELVASLLKKDNQESLYQDLWDYTVSLDKLPADSTQADDLTEWLFTFQSAKPASFDTAVKKWKETSSLPWLVAAISKAQASSASVGDLLAAAEKIRKDSPAYLTVSYHSARLLKDTGKVDAARQKLDALLVDSKAMPATALNRFLAERFAMASNLDEFLKFAQRVPAAVGVDYNGLEMAMPEEGAEPPKGQILLDSDGAGAVNASLPLEWMEQAARNHTLDEELRVRLMRAAWVRAVILDRMDLAEKLVPDVQPLVPESAELFKAVSAESDPQAARFAAVYLLLKNPGLEPDLRPGLERATAMNEMDDFRDNWWCTPEGKPAGSAAFLNDDARAAAAQELQTLIQAGAAPDFLAAQAIQWARAHAQDPRVPEALHRAVKATRFGCTDAATSKLSREAFQILHRNYPKSEWARKTPYYY